MKEDFTSASGDAFCCASSDLISDISLSVSGSETEKGKKAYQRRSQQNLKNLMKRRPTVLMTLLLFLKTEMKNLKMKIMLMTQLLTLFLLLTEKNVGGGDYQYQ